MGALGATFMAANVTAFMITGPLTTAVGAQGVYAVGSGAAVFACVVLLIGLRGSPTPPSPFQLAESGDGQIQQRS